MSFFEKKREPGWYYDLADPPGTDRYWDGKAWTDRTRATPSAPGFNYLAHAYEFRFTTVGRRKWLGMSRADQDRATVEFQAQDPDSYEYKRRASDKASAYGVRDIQTRAVQDKQFRSDLIGATIERLAPVIAEAIVAEQNRALEGFSSFYLDLETGTIKVVPLYADRRPPFGHEIEVPVGHLVKDEIAHRFGSSVGAESRTLQEAALDHARRLMAERVEVQQSIAHEMEAVEQRASSFEQAVSRLAKNLEEAAADREIRKILLAQAASGRGIADIRFVDDTSQVIDITDPVILEVLAAGDHESIDAVRRQMAIRVGGI